MFLSLTFTHTQRPPTGRISVECVHIWIDMLQLTGPVRDRGNKYWFFANMAACWSRGHIHFHHSDTRRKSRVSPMFCPSPQQQEWSKSEEVRSPVRGERGFSEINITCDALHPSLSLCFSLSLCHLCSQCAFSSSARTTSLLWLQFSIVVRFSVPHQPFTLPLNRGTELLTAPIEVPNIHQ